MDGIAAVLPFAIGVAISPVPIIAVILMLFSSRAKVNGPMFALGWAVALAVVSSNAEANVRRVLGPEHAALIGRYECGAALFGKAARFRRVLLRCGVAPADALCIGDEVRDVKAARDAGIAFGAVSWGYAAPEVLRAHGAAVVFGTVEEIAAEVLDGTVRAVPATPGAASPVAGVGAVESR